MHSHSDITVPCPIVGAMPSHITKRLAIFAVLALLLVACGSGESASENMLTPSSAADAEPTPVPTTAPVAVPADNPDEPAAAAATETADSDTADSDTAASDTADSDTTGSDDGAASGATVV